MDVEELRQRLEFEQDALPLSSNLLSRLKLNPVKVEQALEWQDRHENHHLIAFDDPLYPPLLSQITDPPPVLFVKGAPEQLLIPSIAIVGSRNASPGGINAAQNLTTELSQLGYSITSGMALGIDGAAHQAALTCGGATIAVLGTGIDCVYPKRHQSLYHHLVESGCVVSEFWPDTSAYAGNFPKRNRVVTGIALGTVVVEATIKSGSLVSARLAMEQNREVFAVPGSILNPQSQGCHELIKNGAKLVTSAADIIEEIPSLSHHHLEEVRKRHHISGEEQCHLPFPSLLASVGYEATTIDSVVEHSGKPIDLVLVQMLELELQGWVTQVPGGYVRLKRS
ncbi:DNA-processing protein DprA [Shewanella maritima]|uniref:DNA-processing protein DprA n=1 Tax=Shewanella maritima TaxID=2520507 RepID=UPI003735C398